MGKLAGADRKEDKKFLADLIETLAKGGRKLFSFKEKPEIEKYPNQFANRIINENLLDIAPDTSPVAEAEKETDFEPVDINSINHGDVREIGPEWLFKQAMGQLNLKSILMNHCEFSNTLANIALTHIASRAIYPASEHKTAQWIKENSAVAGLFDQPLDKINRFKLYAASNNLYSKKTLLSRGCQKRPMSCLTFSTRSSFMT